MPLQRHVTQYSGELSTKEARLFAHQAKMLSRSSTYLFSSSASSLNSFECHTRSLVNIHGSQLCRGCLIWLTTEWRLKSLIMH